MRLSRRRDATGFGSRLKPLDEDHSDLDQLCLHFLHNATVFAHRPSAPMHRHPRLCVLLLSALLFFVLAAFAADAGPPPVPQLFDCRLCRIR